MEDDETAGDEGSICRRETTRPTRAAGGATRSTREGHGAGDAPSLVREPDREDPRPRRDHRASIEGRKLRASDTDDAADAQERASEQLETEVCFVRSAPYATRRRRRRLSVYPSSTSRHHTARVVVVIPARGRDLTRRPIRPSRASPRRRCASSRPRRAAARTRPIRSSPSTAPRPTRRSLAARASSATHTRAGRPHAPRSRPCGRDRAS
eukprot:30856-Pelagococcus_subviridis.AAC.8